MEAWNEAAQKNAMRYIGDEGAQTIDDFFHKKASHAEELTGDFFRAMNFDPHGKRMLDIGCGIGEMTRAFSDIFGEAYGVDFSDEMIKKAKELNRDKPNLFFATNNGFDLAIYEDNYFDFCFSYEVFQHIPRLGIISNYIREINRILKPWGLVRFQIKGRTWIRAFRVLPIHRSLKNFLNSTGLLKYYCLLTSGDSILARAYPMYDMSRRDLQRVLQDTNLEGKITFDRNTDDMWFSGRKGLEQQLAQIETKLGIK